MISPSRLSLARKLVAAATLTSTILAAAGATTDGLVAYWPLESITTDNTTADVAYTNTLTVVGAPVVGAAKFGNGFTMNTTSYLTNMHDVNNLQTGLPIFRAGAYTIAMWVKGNAQTAKYLFSEGNTGTGITTPNNPLLILQTGAVAANNAKLDIIIRNDTGTASINHLVTATVVFDNAWHHIAFVDNNGAATVYVDGVPDTTNFNYTRTGTYTFNSTAIGTLVRGAIATGNTFTGQLDDVAVWERALTSAEINDVKNNSLPNPVPASLNISGIPASLTKNLGDWAKFTVLALGTRPLSFQWLSNNVEIADATNRTYQTPALTPANSGDKFAVKVTNGTGTQTLQTTVTVVDDPAPNLRNGLVNYWPLDAEQTVSGLLTSKELYSGNDMVLVGFTGTPEQDFVAGQFGNALSFDGARYAYRTNGSPIYNATNYSVSMWVNGAFAGQNDRRVYSEGSNTDNDPLFTIGTDPGGLTASATVFVRNDTGGTALGGKVTARPVFDATWHHLVWTDANGQGKLYVDGVLDETDYSYVRPTLTLNITSLGAVLRAAVGNQFFGAIDEVATWSRVLSFTEINAIKSQGVPLPVEIIPPGITTQPLNHTSGVFAGDNVTFSVQTSGTLPLTYEWYRGTAKIDVSLNPSAATDTLRLTNVTVGDSGSTYYVKVTNPKATVTSDTVTLNVAPYTPVTSGVVLNVDVGLTGSPNPQPGFDEFNLGINGTNYNGVGLTVSGLNGTALADRLRATPTNNPPTLTQAQIYQDFVFANNTTDGTGMRILIERLAPNTKYGVTIWSFDSSSSGARFADWSETSSDTPVALQTGYTFDGSVLPTTDYDRTIRAVLTSSPTGKLQIDAIKNGGTSFGAFLNGIRLVANPTIQITKSTVNSAGNLELTVERLSLDQDITIEQRADLSSGSWAAATGANLIQDNGLVQVYEIPIDTANEKMFFRVSATQHVN